MFRLGTWSQRAVVGATALAAVYALAGCGSSSTAHQATAQAVAVPQAPAGPTFSSPGTAQADTKDLPVAAPTTAGRTQTSAPSTSSTSAPSLKPSTSVASPPAAVAAPPLLPPSSLPNDGTAQWKASGLQQSMQPPPDGQVSLSECISIRNAQSWTEQGYASSQGDPAQEDSFTFADAASAAKSASDIRSAMASCQQTSVNLQRGRGLAADATVTTTASAAEGTAWSRTWTAIPGISAAGPQSDHYYLAQHGKTLIIASLAQLGANPANPYSTAGDSGVLTMLAAQAAE